MIFSLLVIISRILVQVCWASGLAEVSLDNLLSDHLNARGTVRIEFYKKAEGEKKCVKLRPEIGATATTHLTE